VNALRGVSCVLMVLHAGVFCDTLSASGNEVPDDMARNAFQEFQKHVSELSAAGKARAEPVVAGHPSYWQCSDGHTTLAVDLRGNAAYKLVKGWSPNLLAGGKASSRAARHLPGAALVEKTRQLASPWLSADVLRSLQPAIKRETLLLARVPAGAIAEKQGRTIVRLLAPGEIDQGYFQAVFDPNGSLLRVDIAFGNARTKDFCNRALLSGLTPARSKETDCRLTLGCFFDPGEYRFEINAFSVEGEPFLDLEQTSNPFGRDGFDLKHAHRVSVQRYRDSQDYHWWCWAWWQRYGCVGAFRGNFLKKEGRGEWEFPQHVPLHHRSLASYQTLQGRPTRTKVIQQTDGPVEYPFAVSQNLERAFYRDLEECNVAFVFTHGGPIEGVYQVRRGLDVWVVFAPTSRRLGTGNLRHLFLDGCSALTYRREPESAHLVATWIRRAPVNGVRTVSGVDGGASLLDRSGWRFFGHYNRGESVSDSWAFALLDEFIENCPATAGYGNTTQSAVESLLAGRFSDEKAQPNAVAISIWSGSAVR
jgi:hypothetical protein